MFSYINETISGRFDERDLKELYSQVDSTKLKYKDFGERCVKSPSEPYLQYLGTSSTVRDLVSLGDAIVGHGEPIDYWGVSYGTVIGFNFLNSKPIQFIHHTIPNEKLDAVFPEVCTIFLWTSINILNCAARRACDLGWCG